MSVCTVDVLLYFRHGPVISFGLLFLPLEPLSISQAQGFYVLFDVNLSADRAQEWLQYLVDSQFFHRQTSKVKIKLKVYNGGSWPSWLSLDTAVPNLKQHGRRALSNYIICC